MMEKRPVLALLVLLLFCPQPASAQEGDCHHRILPLTVLDSRGRLVQGLTAADFQAKFHGKPVQIISIQPDKRPRRIVILLDASGSMRDVWSSARSIAGHILDARLPNTSFAFLLFSNRVIEQVRFGQGVEAIRSLLQRIGEDPKHLKEIVRGHTALLDSIVEALRLFDPQDSSDSLYVITDAGENASRAGMREVLRALLSSGVRLHLICLSQATRYRPTPEEVRGPNDMDDLVKATGGLSFGAIYESWAHSGGSAEQEARVLADLGRMNEGILNSWRIEIELPESSARLLEWELQPSPNKKEDFKGAKLLYPHRLAACGAAENHPHN